MCVTVGDVSTNCGMFLLCTCLQQNVSRLASSWLKSKSQAWEISKFLVNFQLFAEFSDPKIN